MTSVWANGAVTHRSATASSIATPEALSSAP